MDIKVTLSENEANNARNMAIQNKTSVIMLVQDVVSTIFSGECAYIFLQPAPPAELVNEVREAVNRVINKGRSSIYVPGRIN